LNSSQCNNNKATPALSILALLVASCTGGDGTGLPGGAAPGDFGPIFSEIQANVFTPNCATTGCHLGASAPQGLRLDEANSFGLLVGVPSSESPSTLRVAPGNPQNSYLVQKLEGNAAIGARMPLGAPALEQVSIDVIRQWISDGATDDRIASSQPIKVTSLSPLPGTPLEVAPARLVAMFDRELDVSTVNSLTFLLEASGGDASFGDGNEKMIAASDITTTARSATLHLAGVALVDDTYRVRLIGTGASIIMDLDANALDGEFPAAFPSGDDAAGGDFEARFSLAVQP